MFKRRALMVSVGVLLTLSALPNAQAAMAVVDVRAIVQMAQQLSVLRDQLNTVRNHLTQAQQQYQSMTGSRGMEQLLAGTTRNYLPPDWQALESALNGLRGTYAALAGQLESALRTNAVLSDEQLSRLSPQSRAQLEAARKSAAMLQVTSREALDTSSQRFASLQQLIDAIPRATDQKAVLDLQARIGIEQAMLQNEQTKLQMLHQSLEAEERAREQRNRELAIANFGSLRTRPAIGLNE